MKKIRIKGKEGNYVFESVSTGKRIKLQRKYSKVYKGLAYADQSAVAIKMLNPELRNDPQKVMRFKLEAAISFDHPNIVKNIDFACHESNYYIIQEFIEGSDLQTLRNDSAYKAKLSPYFYASVLIKILEGLEHIHKRDVFHRDLKPSNFMIHSNDNGQINFVQPKVKIIDFGLAKVKGLFINKENVKRIEFPLMYSSPEQILNFTSLINDTSDIYSLGITMYELFAGRPAFYDANPAKIINLQIANNIQDHPLIPPPVMKIIKKATAKALFPKPPSGYSNLNIRDLLIKGQKQRYQSAQEMREDIQKILPGLPKTGKDKLSFFKTIFKKKK